MNATVRIQPSLEEDIELVRRQANAWFNDRTLMAVERLISRAEAYEARRRVVVETVQPPEQK